MREIVLGVDGMTLEDLEAIARGGVRVRLSGESEERIVRSHGLVRRWIEEGRIIYGVTTGFGALSNVTIPPAETRILQENILMSHAAGVGRPLDEETVRAIMALRVKALARGQSGIRLETVRRLADMLNRGIHPVIPEKGSVGASGDLAPLAHLALVLIGRGEAFHEGNRMRGAQALRRCGIAPLRLEAGEGLALVNGTQMTTAIGALAVYDAARLAKLADIAAAMSLEVLLGSRTEFDPRIHEVRPHPGQIAAADNLRRITSNSEIISSHKDCNRVQDAYTLRCSPQVHGASRDAIDYAARVVVTEMNASTDNPLIFPDTEEFLLGGNFHGQPVGLALDFLCMAVAELAGISERRIERLVNPQLSGLPAFLVSEGGLNSGFMLAQYTAAALVSENKVLAHPATVDSIPTSANKEDHVSMSPIAARKCREALTNAEFVIAVELLCGAQALDLFTNVKPGSGTLAAYECIRRTVPHLEKDRVLSEDIHAMARLMRSGTILKEVETAVGRLC
ncbi:histidine ammonia-lyase [Syntrophobacter fumaroxidans]|uniref:Histidine ammonia-lyase n=1 Tax=Syntrophobacter fumaroxidans (strain DSM 10017 / MPOB) TaxID=335543 RepID=A0LKV7_SYNFM|nr:histidine ammonia-lyase [Syntrophobacter fumaroxidans]ABK18059.1 histidine ammonia-lyase [Syntrophobacter fumaroxidans MPOB]